MYRGCCLLDLVGTFLPKIGDEKYTMRPFKCSRKGFGAIQVRLDDFVGEFAMLGRVPSQGAYFELIASLKGAYGFLDSHTAVPARTPFTALGRWNFDGKGKFTNPLTINDNGKVTPITDSGTYTVDTDCTGKIFILGGTGTIEIVLVDGGNEFYELRADPFTTVSLFSANKKQFPDR